MKGAMSPANSSTSGKGVLTCALFFIAGCTSEPGKDPGITMGLSWVPRYSCQSETLFATYRGELVLNGLMAKEHIQIQFSDGSRLDTSAEQGKLAIPLYTEENVPPQIRVGVREKIFVLSSVDSIEPGPIQSFLHRFSISLYEGIKSKILSYSLIKKDSLVSRVFCSESTYEVRPDTVFFNATTIFFDLSGDFRNSGYELALHAPIPNASSYDTYFRTSIFAPFNSPRSSARFGRIQAEAKVDTLPSVATMGLGTGLFQLFILPP
jgi:hypothetical protein